MHIHHLAATLAVLAAAACTQPFTEWDKGRETTGLQREVLTMRQAAEKAQATLDGFLSKASELPAGTKGYALRIKVQQGRDIEYFWLNEFSWSDATFTGRINDEPRLVKGVKPGQIHQFSRSDIVDWTYVDETSGKTFGNFTATSRP